MYISDGWLWFWSLVFVGLVWLLFRARKQIRCLRYCYLSMSEWTYQHLDGIRAYYLDAYGRDDTLDDLAEFDKKWAEEVKENAAAMRRAGIPPLTTSDHQYALEE